MLEILNFIFQSFWTFSGTVILLGVIITIPLHYVLNLINRILRHRNIRIHGYPVGCDTDGDFPEPPDEKRDG